MQKTSLGRTINLMVTTGLKQAFRLLASLKVAIPLLVLLVIVTIIGSLFPEPDWFRSPWYLALLGLQGLSLLFITILHIPSILRRKGRNALLGVIFGNPGSHCRCDLRRIYRVQAQCETRRGRSNRDSRTAARDSAR
jgi:hypothetical protein